MTDLNHLRRRFTALIVSLLALLVTLAIVAGCATWQKDVKPVVKTVDDIAQNMCSLFYGERLGITPQQALETYCETREKWAPWIDQVLAGVTAGAQAKLEAQRPADPPPQVPVSAPVTPVDPPEALAPVPTPETAPQTPPTPSNEGG